MWIFREKKKNQIMAPRDRELLSDVFLRKMLSFETAKETETEQNQMRRRRKYFTNVSADEKM